MSRPKKGHIVCFVILVAILTVLGSYAPVSAATVNFGNTTPGGGGDYITNMIRGSLFVSPGSSGQAFEVQSITAYLKSEGAHNAKCAIYDGLPGWPGVGNTLSYSLVGSTVEMSLGAMAGPDWVTFNFADPKPIVSGGANYVLVCWANLGSTSLNLYWVDFGTGQRDLHTSSNYAPPWPNPASLTLKGYKTPCIYATVNDISVTRGHIIVDKVTVPSGDGQSFGFTLNYGAAFSLTDASEPHDSGALVPGTYSVSETVPPGWDLTSATCSDGSDPGSIGLAAGETVTCTFTDTKRGKIIVDKVTVPSPDGQSFAFTLTKPDSSVIFHLTDASTPYDSDWLPPGTYSVSETVPPGWDLTSATCSDGSDPGSIGLAAGETVTCTFTDTKRGKIIVDKVTNPSHDAQVFDFKLTKPDSPFVTFQLSDDSTPYDSGWLPPGTYSVEETNVPTGWVFDGGSCGDGIDPGSINLAAGETVTCTFRNEKPSGLYAAIKVDKVTNPSHDPQAFDFKLTKPDTSVVNFQLRDDSTPYDSGWLQPGSGYSVAETVVPTGWDLTTATCTGAGNTPGSITLVAGQNVTCTFTDTKRATIIVKKVTVPSPDPTQQSFPFTAGGGLTPGSFSLKDGESRTFSDVVPSSGYSVSESTPTGWDLTSATCDNESPVSNIAVDAGQTVTCTFTNQKVGIWTVLSASVVTLGDSVSDSAFLSGVTPAPGDTVTYNVYDDPYCSGGHLVFTSTKTVVTSGVLPDSDPFTPTLVGHYEWQAVYTGKITITDACGNEPLEVRSGEGQPPVGGDVYTPNKLVLLKPYLALLGLLGAVATAVAITRRRRP